MARVTLTIESLTNVQTEDLDIRIEKLLRKDGIKSEVYEYDKELDDAEPEDE